MMNRLFEINKPEKQYFYAGMFCALGNGILFPISGLILGKFVDVLSLPSDPNFRSKADDLSLIFLYIAISAMVV